MNLFKASLSTFLTKIILFIISIASSVIVVRLIGAEGKGIVSVFQTFFNTILTITYLSVGTGLVYYGLREKRLSSYYDAGITFTLLLSSLLLIIGLLSKDLIQELYFNNIPDAYIYLGLGLFYLNSIYLMTDSYSRASKRPLVYNISHFIENVIYVFIVIIYWFWVQNVSALDIIIAHALGRLGAVVYTYIALKILPVIRLKNFQTIKKMIKFGVKEHIGVISQNLNLRFDILIMGVLLAKEEIGYYSIAVMIAQLVWYIPESVSVFLYPKIASQTNISESANVTAIVNRVTIFIALIVGILIYISGSFFIPFMYGADFKAALLPMNILLIGTVGLSAQKIMTKFFSGIGKPLITSYTAIIGLIINIPMLYVFIPKFGIVGAAIATTVTYSFMGIISIFFFYKINDSKFTFTQLIIFNKNDIYMIINQIRGIISKK